MYRLPSAPWVMALAFQNLAEVAAPLTMAPPDAPPPMVVTVPLGEISRMRAAVPALSTTYTIPPIPTVKPKGDVNPALVPLPSANTDAPLPARVDTVQGPEGAGGGVGGAGGAAAAATQASKVTLPLAPFTPEDTDPPANPTSPTSLAAGPR